MNFPNQDNLLSHGITVIDTHYIRPGFASSYLMVDHGEAAFIETGTASALPHLLNALKAQHIEPHQVKYLITTHIHLDHAGGAGALLQHLPQAKVVVHPLGSRHLIDPSKLVASAKEVYGEETFLNLFGEVLPVPAERLIDMEDNQTLALGQRTLILLDTPGHAKHHLCVWDEAHKMVYTGDTMGISYREFDTPHGILIFPATTPVQFDPVVIHKSIDRLAALQPEWACLSHFGPVRFNRWLADDLHRQIDRMKALAMGARHFAQPERRERLMAGIDKVILSRLSRINCDHISREERERLLKPDILLNAMGLESWLERSHLRH